MKFINIFKKAKQSTNQQRIYERCDDLLDSARSLYQESERLQKIVIEQKVAIEKSSAASQEISNMVETTTDRSIELQQTAQESYASVKDSHKDIEELKIMIIEVNKASDELRRSVESGLESIATVTETMAEIKEKSKIINDIVFQTKLLSFNASVEAARAGEAGKGFAVVAEEMGNLAKASGNASKEIEDILVKGVDKTREQIDSVSKNLESITQLTLKRIEEITHKTNEIGNRFDVLLDNSRQTEHKSKEISHASLEQKTGIQEITKALTSLESNSTQLEEMSKNNNKSSSDLASNIDNLNQMYFNLMNDLNLKLSPIKKKFDFSSAKKAHIDWKMKLTKYIENPDGSLDHNKVCLDDQCALGKWLYGDGQVFKDKNQKLFENLKESHKSFHQSAGEIIKLANSHKIAEAKNLLGADGDYIKISSQTIIFIDEMRDSVLS